MNLFLLRHASAGTSRANPLIDRKRPLDKDGKRHCLQLAALLNAQKTSFDLVVSSPLKRSLQTAQFVATEMGYEAQIIQSEALAPVAGFKDFHRLLQTIALEHPGKENVLVVGHNPNLVGFLGALLLPAAAASLPRIRLRKGSIAHLSMNRLSTSWGPATLQNLIDPRLVRAVYATSTKSSRRKISKK
jgi:phosphohistidine phosphatase